MDRDPETPGAMLDAIRANPSWTESERDAWLGRLVERFTPAQVTDALRVRLDDLSGADAEAVLRLIEANPEPSLLEALARAIEGQPGLAPERAWEALSVLDAAGIIERFPALNSYWEELNELPDDEETIAELVEQIEGDPSTIWLALQGLNEVEPEVRPQIVASLGGREPGPGVVEFARLLAYSPDVPTRDAALGVLESAPDDDPNAAAAWDDLVANHPDAEVAARATRATRLDAMLPALAGGGRSLAVAGRRLIRSLVSAVDRDGKATIILGSERGGESITVAFLCDVVAGVLEVVGDVTDDFERGAGTFREFADGVTLAKDDHSPELALALLSGSLLLGGTMTPPSLRYFVEATAGPGFRPRPLRTSFPDWEPEPLSGKEIAGCVQLVLDACEDWLDDSPLTWQLAEEIELRDGETSPDPKRDAGAYRFFFEHRLLGRLERYRRMLLWMAWFWRATGAEDHARAALTLAWQLSDPASAVPGHPFTVALTTRSLERAQARLRSGATRDRRQA